MSADKDMEQARFASRPASDSAAAPSHTPTPWEVKGNELFWRPRPDSGAMIVARFAGNNDEALANASFALRSANTHQALVDALEWYGEQARLCRLIHQEGDAGRHALNDDGGKRAREALALATGGSNG